VAYTWDLQASRFRGPRGRFVSERQLHGGLMNMANVAGDRMAALTTRLQAGQIQLAEWQAAMMAETQVVHVAASLAGHGGRAMFSPADWSVVSAQVRQQYQYLRAWSEDIANGTAPLDGRLVSRSRLYARSSLGSFELMRERDARNSGAEIEERNVLAAADHCGECPALSARGWVPLGSLPPVGSRRCRANDACRIERRLVGREVAA
jgi:hypothetical protein